MQLKHDSSGHIRCSQGAGAVAQIRRPVPDLRHRPQSSSSTNQPAWHNPGHAQSTCTDTVEPSFISATILLILITDPLGNIPLFIASMRQVEPERRRHIIVRECAIALVVLLIFLFFGQSFLRVLHLTDESIKIAGGVVLFLIAIKMIFPSPGGLFGAADNPSPEPFIVPIAIPLIAGPSAMATVMLMATNDPTRMIEWSLAVAISILVTLVVFLFSDRLQKWLGKQAITAMERLMGLVLTAVSIEMLLSGFAAYWRNLN
ncbi:MarC family protein [Laribacter hongkongensis]|uniref:MarC family protein n=1 Tax=Laribacter hongkongensis TaxID=168471 RepID=UPI001EFE98B5|nr:MarC family protein [Laribacter hongkongensis]MCG9022835.1 MarC family protein [Laribacter hongkongensis]